MVCITISKLYIYNISANICTASHMCKCKSISVQWRRRRITMVTFIQRALTKYLMLLVSATSMDLHDPMLNYCTVLRITSVSCSYHGDQSTDATHVLHIWMGQRSKHGDPVLQLVSLSDLFNVHPFWTIPTWTRKQESKVNIKLIYKFTAHLHPLQYKWSTPLEY